MRSVFLALLSFISSMAIAQHAVDRLVLKDGSLHEGYIKLQRVGKDFIFVSEKTTATITGATISQKQVLNIDKLPEPWKKWAKENKSLFKKSDEGLSLSDIIFNMAKGEDLKNVYVLEEGDEIKYVDLTERTDTIPLAKIQSVERIPAPDSVLSKTVDVITRKNGDIEEVIKGMILSQVPGEKVKIMQESGVIKVVKFSDVISERKEKGCPELSFCEQSRYLEIVRTTSKGKEFEGVITMRYYGNDSEDGYLLVTDKDDQSQKVWMKDVTEIQKTFNDKGYIEKIKLDVEDDHVYVNQSLSQWYQAEVSTILSSKKIEVKGDDSGIIKIKLPESASEVLVEITMKNTKENKESTLLKPAKILKDYRFSFSYETIVKNKIEPQSSDILDNQKESLCRSYTLQKGEYVLYRKSDQKCVLFIIE